MFLGAAHRMRITVCNTLVNTYGIVLFSSSSFCAGRKSMSFYEEKLFEIPFLTPPPRCLKSREVSSQMLACSWQLDVC
jgi:hypothetical protein